MPDNEASQYEPTEGIRILEVETSASNLSADPSTEIELNRD
jgi:hypothetical protein